MTTTATQPLNPRLPPLAAETLFSHVIWYEPTGRYIVATADGEWLPEYGLSQLGLEAHLVNSGLALADVRGFLARREFRVVSGILRQAGAPRLFRSPMGLFLNSWVPPASLSPPEPPGDWPRIRRALGWLTNHDPAGYEWLLHWTAAKVQDPMWQPKTAVLFTGAPGSGKNYYGEIVRELLGRENTAHVAHGALESNFNHRWADKLFVFADECVTSDNARTLSEKLKIWIANSELEIEAKYQNQRPIPNHLAWVFASNDDTLPLKITKGDRRYSVFANFDPVPPDHQEALRSCFENQATSTFTTEFLQGELAAFSHYLQNLEVDRALIIRPYENATRTELIRVNDASHHTFFEAVDECGLDLIIDQYIKYGSDIAGERKTWDWGEEGIATAALYHLYVKHTRDTGAQPMKINKFGMAIRNNKPDWKPVKHYVESTKGRVQVRGYQVPRKAAAVEGASVQ